MGVRLEQYDGVPGLYNQTPCDNLTGKVWKHHLTPVQPGTPVGSTVQIKQLIIVPDRVLCTSIVEVPYTVCLWLYSYCTPANWTDGSKYGSTESAILWAVSLQFPLYVSLVGGDLHGHTISLGSRTPIKQTAASRLCQSPVAGLPLYWGGHLGPLLWQPYGCGLLLLSSLWFHPEQILLQGMVQSPRSLIRAGPGGVGTTQGLFEPLGLNFSGAC